LSLLAFCAVRISVAPRHRCGQSRASRSHLCLKCCELCLSRVRTAQNASNERPDQLADFLLPDRGRFISYFVRLISRGIRVSAVQSVKWRRLAAVVAAVVLACIWRAAPGAQGGITITFPGKLAAGPDYATDVLKDAWDFSNPEDLSLDPGESIGWQGGA